MTRIVFSGSSNLGSDSVSESSGENGSDTLDFSGLSAGVSVTLGDARQAEFAARSFAEL